MTDHSNIEITLHYHWRLRAPYDAFEKVSGRYIHILSDVTYISTIRIRVLASNLYITISLLVSTPKISKWVHTDYILLCILD